MSFSEELFSYILLSIFPKETEKSVWLFELPFGG